MAFTNSPRCLLNKKKHISENNAILDAKAALCCCSWYPVKTVRNIIVILINSINVSNEDTSRKAIRRPCNNSTATIIKDGNTTEISSTCTGFVNNAVLSKEPGRPPAIIAGTISKSHNSINRQPTIIK
ncbi:hypothetical protein [Agriterribacter sp.]|uniref:hypothetical protein n=1 Tax=Agriterribacter sp. TaxID=2821509 RepID=UPI0039C8A244